MTLLTPEKLEWCTTPIRERAVVVNNATLYIRLISATTFPHSRVWEVSAYEFTDKHRVVKLYEGGDPEQVCAVYNNHL